jgi:hypothetical protein
VGRPARQPPRAGVRARPVAPGARLRHPGPRPCACRRLPRRLPRRGGRGHSDWLADPMGYQIPAYVADMLALLASCERGVAHRGLGRHQHGRADRHGLAGQPGLPLPAPVRRLVLNDVGPVIQWEALQRIGDLPGAHRCASTRCSRRPMRCGRCPASFGPAHARAVAGAVPADGAPAGPGGRFHAAL